MVIADAVASKLSSRLRTADAAVPHNKCLTPILTMFGD